MALHIEDPEIERRVREWSERQGVSIEEVLRRALDSEEAQAKARYDEIVAFLAASKIKPSGSSMTKEEEAEILGYGPDGLCS